MPMAPCMLTVAIVVLAMACCSDGTWRKENFNELIKSSATGPLKQLGGSLKSLVAREVEDVVIQAQWCCWQTLQLVACFLRMFTRAEVCELVLLITIARRNPQSFQST